MRTSNRSRHRGGHTLIEMVVVIATLVALGATSLAVLQALNKTNAHAVAHSASIRDTLRLADVLRELAHDASAVELQDNGGSLVVTDDRYEHHFRKSSDNETINYFAESISSPLPSRHDQFLIGECDEVLFVVETSPSMIVAQWVREQTSRTPVRIEAMLAEGVGL